MAHAECAVKDVRYSHHAERTRLVLDIKPSVPYRFKRDGADATLNVQTQHCVLDQLPTIPVPGGYIANMDWRVAQDGHLVLFLRAIPNTVYKHFSLGPNKHYGHRIVVDFNPAPRDTSIGRDIIIAVDAGHGGEDSGAISVTGEHEKHLVLSVARYIVAELNTKPGLRGILVRDADVYLSLEERAGRARVMNADAFLSIHGDAFHDKRVSGVSVYALSANAAEDVISKHLAGRDTNPRARESLSANRLKRINPHLPTAVANLSMRFAMERSIKIGQHVLKALRKVTKAHNHAIKQAGFVVLRPIDVPSILVELGFLTNPAEARALRKASYQHRLAQAIADGVEAYFKQYPISDSQLSRPTNNTPS